MTSQIKCEQIEGDWSFDFCLNCKHFRSGDDIKNRWRCKLNSDPNARRDFYRIWLFENAIAAKILSEDAAIQVSIEYVGKKKRTKKFEKGD